MLHSAGRHAAGGAGAYRGVCSAGASQCRRGLRRTTHRPFLVPYADQRRYWVRDPATYQFISAEQISNAFYSDTDAGRAVTTDLATPFPAIKDAGKDAALVTSR